MTGTKAIAAEVAATLRASRLEGRSLFLPPALDRALYTRVNAVIQGLGGTWQRKAGAHVFPFDAADVLAQALDAESYVDRAKALQFYPTPAAVARDLIAMADIRPGDTVLEPSAGVGDLVRHVPAHAAQIVAIEIDAANVVQLRELTAGDARVEVLQDDFLAYAVRQAEPCCDVVVMNPPFTRGQDMQHVLAAFELLRPGGRLAAVVSEGPFFRADKQSEAFREWLEDVCADVEQLPSDAFRTSGAGAATRLIAIRRPAAPRALRPSVLRSVMQFQADSDTSRDETAA